MANKFIVLKGDKKLKDKISSLGKISEDILRDELNVGAINIHRNAVQKAPVDTGRLKQSIQLDQKPSEVAYRVYTNVHYAPYIEFGTGNLTVVPSELKAYAEQFRGKGLKAVNLPARAFLFPAFFYERGQIVKRIKRRIASI